MCGICGIIDIKKVLPLGERGGAVAAMNQSLYHRGPDDAGTYTNLNCHLAMRRLAIIDLKMGHQPLFNETEDVGVFLNGEIYNYRELKNELLAKGHHFRTDSDTEVLAHLYEDCGTDMLPRLKGMFAFCLFDLRDQSFLLARDRFGEKPLYYHYEQEVFSFSSEVASLLKNRRITRKLNIDLLPYYFRTSLIPEPFTLLESIQSVPPGHFLQLREGQMKTGAYFAINYQTNPDLKSTYDAVDFIRPILEKAVQRQTVSDVPIGAFLSGGIDSSTVVALLQEQSKTPVKTFHVRFEDQDYDESKVAREVAKFCGTDHHEMVVPNYDFQESIFWEILDHVGLPFRDSSAIPTYLISKAIRKEVKVALSGDGGDELFGGYSLFRWYRQITNFQQLPQFFRSALYTGLGWSQQMPGLNGVSKVRQFRRAVGTSLKDRLDIVIDLNEMFPEESIRPLFSQTWKSVNQQPFEYPFLKTYPSQSRGWSPLREVMYYRMQHTLPANMLVKVDRMSMANSLEVRAPFLDPDLFQAAAQLPDKLLIRHGEGKYLLRKIIERKLPREVFDHPKTGFNIPLYKYQNQAFQVLAQDLLLSPNPLHEILDRSALETLYRNGVSNHSNSATTSVFQSAHQLWMMMMLFGWVRRFEVQV